MTINIFLIAAWYTQELLLQISTKLDTLITLFKANAGASGQRLAAVKEEEDNSAFIVSHLYM